MKPAQLSDSGQHYCAAPQRVAHPADENELRDLLAEAAHRNWRVSVMGAGKSQGGLILCDGLVVSTKRLRRIIEIDPQQLSARVEPGVTWDELRDALLPHGLAACATQSYGLFSIGGSVAVNAHGRNVDVGVLAATVQALRVMRADGSVVPADRRTNAALFSLVLGGFGLFGIVTEVKLRLTRNDVYRRACVAAMPCEEYPRYFAARVAADADLQFHYARFDVDDERPWQRLFCVDYRRLPEADAAAAEVPEPREDVAFQRLTLGLFRRFRWARRLRFGGDLAYRARFRLARRSHVAKESWQAIARDSGRSVDWLQEFFVPTARFLDFVQRAQAIFRDASWVPLNTTVRFVPRNTDAFLSYARENVFSFVLFFAQRRDAEAVRKTEAVLRRLLDAAIECGGSFYLCYQRIASHEQLRRAHPHIEEFFAMKRALDPQDRFHNQFYGHYAGARLPAAPATPTARPLRLPEAERHSVLAADGTELLLQRFRGGDRGPVICAAGYAMSSSVFLLDTVETNLTEYLCDRGHDVWLFSWRSSPDVAASRTRFTLDDVARHDWPAAVAAVRRLSGAAQVDCVVHCIGSQTLLMSAALGLLDGQLKSVLCLQAGLHYDNVLLARLKARLRMPELLDAIGVRAIAASSHVRGAWYRLLDAALRLYPIARAERCGHATCRRSAFLWGDLLRHANVDEASHARMPDLLGHASILPFVQMTRGIRDGHITDAQGRDVYRAGAPQGLRLPVTFVHGSSNVTLCEGSTRETYELLLRHNDPQLYRRHVVEGFGHMDCLIGREAPRRVYPLIGEHLDWAHQTLAAA